MNSSVEQSLDNLIDTIKNDDVYLEYKKQLDLLRQDPELKRQVDDFRKRNYDMQMDGDLDFAKLDSFREEYREFRTNPLVDSFLAAELDFCRMMQNINFKIIDAVDFE
jgi:cell fate (sporulation/competence/biofilm development) regulator YlbF (YheA/YmcA/DUF963 family)